MKSDDSLTLRTWDRTSTTLRGTLLIRRIRTLHADFIFHLPVEWLHIDEARARNPKWLMLPSMLFFAVFVANALFGKAFPDDPRFENLAPRILLLGIAVVVVGLVLWLVPERTVRIRSQPGMLMWDLYHSGKAEDEFLQRLEAAIEVAKSKLRHWPSNVGFVVHKDRPFRFPTFLLVLQIVLLLSFGGTPGVALFFLMILVLLGLRMVPRMRLPKPYWQALHQLDRGAYQAAVEVLNPFLRRYPGHQPSRVLLAEIYLRAGWIEEALAACRQLEDVDPESAVAMRDRVRLAEHVHERLETVTA